MPKPLAWLYQSSKYEIDFMNIVSLPSLGVRLVVVFLLLLTDVSLCVFSGSRSNHVTVSRWRTSNNEPGYELHWSRPVKPNSNKRVQLIASISISTCQYADQSASMLVAQRQSTTEAGGSVISSTHFDRSVCLFTPFCHLHPQILTSWEQVRTPTRVPCKISGQFLK